MSLSTTNSQAALDLERHRPRIDAALARYVEFDEGCPPRLAEAIRYALLGPGKRLRPQLVLMAAEACGGLIESALPAACAVEMVHAYSLVHDDLPAMDDDDFRRGRPACHKVFGEAVAILAGDALLARAFEVLASEVQPPSLASRCCAVLARAAGAAALVGGQVADLEFAAHPQAAVEHPLRELASIHHRKTGALFTAALELGGMTAHAEPEQIDVLVSYGRKVGLAFQITDDLLDAGSEKLAFPTVLGVEESRQRTAQLVNEACAKIEILGPKAEPLRALARYISSRDS